MTRIERRRRVRVALNCEPLEGRQLLSTLSRPGQAVSHGVHVSAVRLVAAPSIFTEPQDGRGPILQAINSARSQIRLGICNISDRQIGDALAAAVARGVNVRVIVDQADYHAKVEEQQEVASLVSRGVSVHISNPVFRQSFEKELVIDKRVVLIMTMCLVPPTFEDTRDFGLVLANRGVIREVTSVFETDWAFSAAPGAPTAAYNPTPALRVRELIWGPTNGTSKLSQLIQSARRSIDATTELLDDPYLEGQLIAAAGRGVRVRVITPIATRENTSNSTQAAFLESHGVNVRTTRELFPPANAQPYMHAKTMIVDGRNAYLGSIDLETVTATQSRELGILFRQRRLIRKLSAQFQSDWNQAQVVGV